MRPGMERLVYWDEFVFRRIFQLDQKWFLNRFIPAVSRSGDGYFYPILPLFLFALDLPFATAFLKAGLIGFAIELTLYKLIKHYVRRIRPFEALGVSNRMHPSDRFSFPSGHTGAAFLTAMLVSHFFPVASIPVFCWAAMVGLSRIYLGVHYPTDVLVGAFVGLISACTGLMALA